MNFIHFSDVLDLFCRILEYVYVYKICEDKFGSCRLLFSIFHG